jgi:DNA-directed RNA polymerase subunit L
MANDNAKTEVEITEKYIKLKIHDQTTALVNGLRRTMLNHVMCYAFVDEMEPSDYLLLTGMKEERRHTVLIDTLASQSIPILAHRCSRIPIFTSDETHKVLESTDIRKVFFVICEQSGDILKTVAKPYVHTDRLIKRIYSRDLIPMVLKFESEKFVYDEEASDKIKGMMKTIFPYNVLVAQMSYGDELNIILKPVKGIGLTNCIWGPCTFNYRYIMDPRWVTDRGERLYDQSGALRRKMQGERSTRDLFTIDPGTLRPYNRFGKPYGIELMFRYNGKMHHIDAFQRSISKMHDALDMFLAQYLTADTDTSVISKEIIHQNSEDGQHDSTVEMLHVPKNTQDKLSEEQLILAGHTMGNLVTTKMLEIIDRLIGADVDIWPDVHIAYKIPHPLIKQCVLMIKLSSKLTITHEELIKQAIQGSKDDLNRLSTAVSDS